MDLVSAFYAIPVWITVPLCFVVIFFGARFWARHKARPGRLRDGVEGTGHIVSVTTYSRRDGSSQGYVALDLVVEAPGVPATAIRYTRSIMVRRWPQPGDVVPVSIDPQNPSRCVILWGELPNPEAIGESRAEQLAADLRASSGAAAPSMGTGMPAAPPAPQAGAAHSGAAHSGAAAESGEQKLRVDAAGCSIVGSDGERRRVESLSELDPSLQETVRGVWDNAVRLVGDSGFALLPAGKQQQMRDLVANLGYLFR